jgi:hypothetical protein
VNPPFDISSKYVNQYSITFQAVDLYDCPDAVTGEMYLCPQTSPVVGTISPSGSVWEDAGNPFEVTQTPEGVYQGFGVGCGYTTCYWSTSTTAITFPSGCAHITDNTCGTEFTADGSGVIYADFGIPDYGGSSPPTVCPEGSVLVDGECVCSGEGCAGLAGWYVPIVDPAYVLVTAPDGVSQVGCNSTGGMVDTLLGAVVSSCAGTTGNIIVTDPPVGKYEIQIFSVGASSSFDFNIVSVALDGSDIGTTGLTGTVSSGTPEVEYLTLGSSGCLSLSPSASATGCSAPAGVGVPQFALAAPVVAAVGLLALVLVRRKSSPGMPHSRFS